MNFKLYTLLLFLLSSFSGIAALLDDAKELYIDGKYKEALPLFMEQYQKTPTNPSLNQWIGVCLFKTDKRDEAVKYFTVANTKGVLEAPIYLAEINYKNYNFKEAELLIDKYQKELKKGKKTATPDASKFIEMFKTARGMLDHVEKIQIIDSIIVDKASFFKAYKISPEVGSLKNGSVLPYEKENASTVVFIPQNNEHMMWAAPDSAGVSTLMETNKLIDGKWDKYTKIGENLKEGGDVNYPYMMPDGTTMYFASNGKNSIGGYDIFVTRKDPAGGFLQPQNVGMPFNSPFDDYLLVVDEFTGVGWWATDRKQIQDKITIYIYIPSDIRVNYDADDENIASLAAIKSIRDTWSIDANYSELISEINNINTDKPVRKKEFIFPVANGKLYTSLDDFKSSEARNIMEQYVKTKKELESNIVSIEGLRKKYSSANINAKATMKTEILQLETQINRLRTNLEDLANSVRRAEK